MHRFDSGLRLMDPTWMALASLLFQIGLLIALIVCCLLIKVFVLEVAKKFSSDTRHRTMALLGGFLFALVFLIFTVFTFKGKPVTQTIVISELLGFLGRFGVASLILSLILGRITDKTT